MNVDDWTDDEGGFDFEEFQEDVTTGAVIFGALQRSQQKAQQRKISADLNEVKSLLREQEQQQKLERKRQEAERREKENQQKCPFCLESVNLRASVCAKCRSEIEWIILSDGPRVIRPELYSVTLNSLLTKYELRCDSEQRMWDSAIATLRDSINGARDAFQYAYEQSCSSDVFPLHMARAEEAVKRQLERPPIGRPLLQVAILLFPCWLFFDVKMLVVCTLVILGIAAHQEYYRHKDYNREYKWNRASLRVVESFIEALKPRLLPCLFNVYAATKQLKVIQRNRNDYLTLCNEAGFHDLPHPIFPFETRTATVAPPHLYRCVVEAFANRSNYESFLRKEMQRWIELIHECDSYLNAVA